MNYPSVRSTRSLSRRRAARESRDRVLIVCEGSKTEPNYFRDLIYSLGLTSADVTICGEECGSDPKSILMFALRLFKMDPDYDPVFCVFDQDSHTNFQATLRQISELRVPHLKKLEAITSVPCFEVWIILHFVNSSAPIVATRRLTAGQAALRVLKPHYPDYSKTGIGVFAATKNMLPEAIQRSKNLLNLAARCGFDNPSTRVHKLIEHLTEIIKTPV